MGDEEKSSRMPESKMTALLRKPLTHVGTGTHGLTHKLCYPVCGFVLEIGVKPIIDREFGTMVWDGLPYGENHVRFAESALQLWEELFSHRDKAIEEDSCDGLHCGRQQGDSSIVTAVRLVTFPEDDPDYSVSEISWLALLLPALGLCQYFEEQKMNFSQKKVIELGAGTGILSILTALLGGDVTVTDKPQLLKQIETNVSANVPSSCRPPVKIRALSWGSDHTLFPSDYDYILGGDIVYTSASIPLLLKTLQHLSNERTVIYFASTMSICLRLVTSGYQTLFQYFDSDLVCRYENRDVNLYRMTKKKTQC
ncbi:EEF1A lysine methyltransferase 3-like [Cetorhinus maximus]